MPHNSAKAMSKRETFFTKNLLKWDKEQNNRSMPWKGERDPYKIWLSEIILQQTRVEQGLAYYERFINAFPNVHLLANASEKKVMKLWEGLGYYSRCRNLHASAQFISKRLNGIFPNDYDSIKSLKGVGPYTAAAISSFAFNLPYAVLDGNVFRVLARVFGIETPIDTNTGKKEFIMLATRLLDKKQPGVYNQAIMDFGAIVCKPIAPNCSTCIFKKQCIAYNTNTVANFPVKQKKIKIQKRFFSFLIIEYKTLTAIYLRNTNDIWKGLYSFPIIETKKATSEKSILNQAEKENIFLHDSYQLLKKSNLVQQRLTHQIIAGKFIHLQMKQKPTLHKNIMWVATKKLNQFPFPKMVKEYIEKQTK